MKAIILLFTLFSSCVPQSHQRQTTVKVESDSNKIQNQNSYHPIQKEAPYDSIKKSQQSIELTLSPTVYPKSCEGINVIFTNYSSQTLTYGLERYFEFYNHGKWERINFNKEGAIYVFDAIGFELPPNISQIMYYSLNQKLHTYISGKYRIYVPFTIENKKDFRTVEFTLK